MNPYKGPWTDKQLTHLLRRTLFGVTAEDLGFFKGKSMEQCVDTLLRPIALPVPPIFFTKDDPAELEHKSFISEPENKARDEDWRIYVRAWWVGQMLNPQRNITEKMTLFWHNHFVVEFNVVKDARYAYEYVNILRQNATGNFKKLLKEITVSPAMLVYLNGNQNISSKPNENYGRELQELFTVGKGSGSHYTESDVKAAARVLTGWKDDKKNINSYFEAAQHTVADKTFSAFYGNRVIKGQSGADGAKETDELLDMICATSEVPRFICRKLYRWFVHSKIDAEVEKNVIVPLAGILQQNNYELKPVLKALLTGSFFYEQSLVGAMFKSPADYFIGTVRQLKMKLNKKAEGGPPQYLGAWFLVSEVMSAMGQLIGNPPNVAGWPAYYEFPSFDKNWVNSEYLSMRNRYKDFTFDGFNPPDDPYIEFDSIGYLNHLPDAASSKAVVAGTLGQLCVIQPDEKHFAYLEAMLDAKKTNGKLWAEIWTDHKKNLNDSAAKKELDTRLRKAFDVIVMLPEYQIM